MKFAHFYDKKSKTENTVNMRFFHKVLRFLFLCACIATAAVLGYYLAATKNDSLSHEKLSRSDIRLVVYDEREQEIKNAAAHSRTQTVPLGEIPSITQDAFLCIEDRRFYRHRGFDLKRIVGASLRNIKARAFKEGASTISQQLIKNTHLSPEKTLKRKLREWKLTYLLEKNYSKSEILELYLNTIYFGHDCFGIGAASAFYFDKEPKDLTLAESATLAGLVRSPNNYSPFRHANACKQRRKTVLSVLCQQGKISQIDYKNADEEPLPTTRAQESENKYLPFVFEEWSAWTEQHEQRLGGKIEIFTYLDPLIQKGVEESAAQIQDCEKQILVLNQAGGGYKAAYHSVGTTPRLPGSIIKPLLVYTPAIEENLLSPATPVLDEKTEYGDYRPENYAKRYYGYVSARECVEKSLNIPAVKTLSALGIKKGVAYLHTLGLEVPKEDYSLALALGGMQRGFSLQALTEAYSVFPSGEKTNGSFIKAIKINGVTVYRHTPVKTRAFSEESAFLMTDMLKSTAQNGTAKKLRTLPFDVAAKTGTAGTSNGNTDAYTIALTTKDVVGVWLGNRDNRLITHTGGGGPCNLAKEILEGLYRAYQEKGETIPKFCVPKEVVCVTLDKLSYTQSHACLLADDAAPAAYRFQEYFKKTQTPKKQADFFSAPSITTPTAVFEHGKIQLFFPNNAPDFYRYKIERYDYVKHSTLYEGGPLHCFVDADILPDKKYVYTVTPFYGEHAGTPIELPEIFTKSVSDEKNAIIDKDWWAY